MNYIISEDELVELLASCYKLAALENRGVDNWVWYDTSISDWEEEYGTFEKNAKDELINYRKADEE